MRYENGLDYIKNTIIYKIMTRLNKVKKLLELHYINPEQYIPKNDYDAWNMYPKYN